MTTSKKFYETKRWIVATYEKSYQFRSYLVIVQFVVKRKIVKMFWGFCKYDTLIYKNDYESEVKRKAQEVLNRKEMAELNLRVKIDALQIQLKHVR